MRLSEWLGAWMRRSVRAVRSKRRSWGWSRAGLARIGESALLPRPLARGARRTGLDEGASARQSRASQRIVCFRWGSATGSRANQRFRPRPRLFIPLVLFLGSKQFFDLCLGYPIFWYPTVAPEPRAGVWDTLPEVFSRLLFLSGSCRVCFILAILVGARERTHRV